MGRGSLLREAWEIIPIVLLVVVGGVIVLQSGVQSAASGQDSRQRVANLSQMLLRLTGYVALFLVLQSWIGQRPALGW
jgi:hypothetical protein